MPLIGLVRVVDRPFEEFQAEVRAAFALELADPEMVLTPYRRVSVLGEVRQPGYHWMEPAGTLLDALVLSGGLLPSAKRKHVLLTRRGAEIKLELDADGAAEAMPLQSGDRLLVERRSWISENLAIFVGAAASVAAAAVTTLIVR